MEFLHYTEVFRSVRFVSANKPGNADQTVTVYM